MPTPFILFICGHPYIVGQFSFSLDESFDLVEMSVRRYEPKRETERDRVREGGDSSKNFFPSFLG